jgi:hypothetical protein
VTITSRSLMTISFSSMTAVFKGVIIWALLLASRRPA